MPKNLIQWPRPGEDKQRGSNAVIIFSKIPLRDKKGEIVGLAGVWREVDSESALPPAYNRLSGIVEMMHERYTESITVNEMAAKVGLSRSQFGRLFRKLFGLSPQNYLKSRESMRPLNCFASQTLISRKSLCGQASMTTATSAELSRNS